MNHQSSNNRLVFCDLCHQYVHQECHAPVPLTSIEELPKVWGCGWCLRGTGERRLATPMHNCRAFLTEDERKCRLCDKRVYTSSGVDEEEEEDECVLSGPLVTGRVEYTPEEGDVKQELTTSMSEAMTKEAVECMRKRRGKERRV